MKLKFPLDIWNICNFLHIIEVLIYFVVFARNTNHSLFNNSICNKNSQINQIYIKFTMKTFTQS